MHRHRVQFILWLMLGTACGNRAEVCWTMSAEGASGCPEPSQALDSFNHATCSVDQEPVEVDELLQLLSENLFSNDERYECCYLAKVTHIDVERCQIDPGSI